MMADKPVEKKRTMHFSDEAYQEVLLNKMLEKYNITVEHVVANPEIDGIPWYQYYTNTTQEDLDWREWCYQYTKANVIGQSKLKKDFFEKWMALFYLCYSLKIQD